MKKLAFLIILQIIILNTVMAQSERMEYKIVIINRYFGKKNHITTIDNQQLIVQRGICTKDGESFSRDITEVEQKKVRGFLERFPLNELKDAYIYSGVKDGTQMTFYIKVNETEKEIAVANALQQDLADLVALVVTLLSEDYIGYNKERVEWEADS